MQNSLTSDQISELNQMNAFLRRFEAGMCDLERAIWLSLDVVERKAIIWLAFKNDEITANILKIHNEQIVATH